MANVTTRSQFQPDGVFKDAWNLLRVVVEDKFISVFFNPMWPDTQHSFSNVSAIDGGRGGSSSRVPPLPRKLAPLLNVSRGSGSGGARGHSIQLAAKG
jgi:hypothetical protein